MRVIIDTNVYVSYLLTGRRASPITEVLHAVSEGYVHLTLPAEQISELHRVVTRKPALQERVPRLQLDRFIALLTELGDVLEPLESEPPRIVRDRHDDYLIESARRANVDILVSGDRDLLASNESQSVVEVMSPADLLDRLAEAFRQES